MLLTRIASASRRASRAAETIRVSSEEIAQATAAARDVLARSPRSGGSRSSSPRRRLLSWSTVRAGQTVTLRGKRSPGEVQVTIAEVLPRVLGDGLGIRTADGTEYRQYFYDVREADASSQ